MRKLCLGLIFLFSTVLLSGCVVAHRPPEHESYKHGPPPHAPAHGYRHHQHGVDLVFDSGIGVYVIIGHPGIYFYNGLYLNFGPTGHWRAAKHYKGPWHAKDIRHTPLRFRNKMLKREHGEREKALEVVYLAFSNI